MEIRGMVSLWFGVSESLEKLEEYFDIEYTEDGDSKDSKFGVNFQFGYYNEDEIEICFYDTYKNRIHDILKDFSYSEVIIPNIKRLVINDYLEHGINTVIVLYDFSYNKAKVSDKTDDISVEYIGTVNYI